MVDIFYFDNGFASVFLILKLYLGKSFKYENISNEYYDYVSMKIMY